MLIPVRLRILLASPVLASLAFAQQPAPPRSPNDLHLDVVVSTKNGAAAGALQEKDFTVLDNKVPQPLTSFRLVDKNAPVEVIFVVDAVNATAVNVAYERDQIDKYLLANGGVLSHPTSLAVLTDKGIQAQGGGTLDGNVLAKSLAAVVTGFRFIGRSTGFYGAEERLDLSLNGLRLLVDQQAQRPGRKLIVWISPGWPLLSGPGVEMSSSQQQAIFRRIVDLSTRLRNAGVTLYQVDPLGSTEGLERRVYYQQFTKGILKPTQTDAADISLQVLATQSGGLVLNGSNDIAALMKKVTDDAASYYVITVAPSPGEHPQEYHQIEVRVDRPGLIARTRQGYYAQP